MPGYPPSGTIGKCSREPLPQVTLQHYYNENRDIEDFLDQSMLREIFRPAKPVNMTVRIEVRFVEAPAEGSLVWKTQWELPA
jgi:hypothetical protein